MHFLSPTDPAINLPKRSPMAQMERSFVTANELTSSTVLKTGNRSRTLKSARQIYLNFFLFILIYLFLLFFLIFLKILLDYSKKHEYCTITNYYHFHDHFQNVNSVNKIVNNVNSLSLIRYVEYPLNACKIQLV